MRGFGVGQNAWEGWGRRAVTLVGVFLFCLLAGLLAGNYMKQQGKEAAAVSSNITVLSNEQIITQDQGNTTIIRTGTVNIKDSTATWGYVLSARVSQNSIPNATVKIGSGNSNTCTIANPCATTTDTTPTDILETSGTTATLASGDTTQWTVTITIPAGTPLGNYIVDIEYSEEAVIPPPPTLLDMTYLQDLALLENQEVCANTSDRTRVVLKDRRNDQDYYVEKIAGSGEGGTDLCWMETNLRYAGGGNWNSAWGWADDRDNLALGTTNSYTTPYYYNPGGSTDYTNTAANGGFYGYLYNWCAAMGGQASACSDSISTQPSTTTSICPAGWRLPGGGDTATTAGNDFGTLNNAINGGSTLNDSGLRTNFLAVYSGGYYSSLFNQGSRGGYWSSTMGSDVDAYDLYFGSGVYPGTDYYYKSNGYAVRCVL